MRSSKHCSALSNFAIHNSCLLLAGLDIELIPILSKYLNALICELLSVDKHPAPIIVTRELARHRSGGVKRPIWHHNSRRQCTFLTSVLKPPKRASATRAGIKP